MSLMKLDEWQEEVLKTEGNICVRSGRQVGKSTVISIKAAEYAVKHKNKEILVISATERQAYLLFSKILYYLDDHHPSFLKKGKERPTKSEIKLLNGSIIRCLPTGLDGLGIRGYTTHMLIADEAHFIPEEVWAAVTPQLVTTEAIQILISTTHGRDGYFYHCFSDPTFTPFHITTEEVALKRPEPMRSNMLRNLEQERKIKSKLQFAQEYEGEFVDEFREFFPVSVIRACMDIETSGYTLPMAINKYDKYLGVDVARMGEDQSVEVSVYKLKDHLYQFDMRITTKTLTTDTVQDVLMLDRKFKYKKIYIDDGGLGVAVFDPLLLHEQTKRKVVPINNSVRSLDRDSSRNKKLLKEDLYNNLLVLLEQKRIHLFNDPEILLSLRSIQAEYDNGKLKIFGNYTHICEALIRAAWCIRDKTLNVYLA